MNRGQKTVAMAERGWTSSFLIFKIIGSTTPTRCVYEAKKMVPVGKVWVWRWFIPYSGSRKCKEHRVIPKRAAADLYARGLVSL